MKGEIIMSLTISNPSIVHTFGNVACVAMNYIQSFFPEDFFTKTHISTKMSHRQLNVYRAGTGFWKNKKPMLVLRPRIDFDSSSNWFYGSAMMSRMTHSSSPMEFGDLVPIIHDPENAVDVQFLWNRYRIVYDVAIIVDTYNAQINIMNDLRNRLNIEYPYRIKTVLEAYIPKSVIFSIADYMEIDHNDTAKILEYLNTVSTVPITYKIHDGSGTEEFFMMYPTSIESIATDLTPDDGETRGIIADTFTISLSLSMEFNAVGVWYTFMMDGYDVKRMAPMDNIAGNNGERIIPVSSIPLGYNLGLEAGWKILESPFYFTSVPEDQVDETDISSILDMYSVKTLIEHHTKMHIPLEEFLQFRVFKGDKEIPRGVNGFDISLEKKCVYTYHPQANIQYRLFVLINSLAINDMATEIMNYSKLDSANYTKK